MNGRKRVASYYDASDDEYIRVQMTRKVSKADRPHERMIAKTIGHGYLVFFFKMKIETARALHKVLGDAIAEADKTTDRAIPLRPVVAERKSVRPSLWNRFYGRWLPW